MKKCIALGCIAVLSLAVLAGCADHNETGNDNPANNTSAPGSNSSSNDKNIARWPNDSGNSGSSSKTSKSSASGKSTS